MVCPNCDEDIKMEEDFDHIGDEVVCTNCNSMFEICYEERWDGEEEFCWFYLEEMKNETTGN